MIGPKIDELSEKMKDLVVFLKVDVDENEEIAGTYEVTAMPTFVLVKERQVLEKFSGASDAKLLELISKHK